MAMNSQSLSKEQVLIVGCGDIGRRLAECLSREKYAVTGLRRTLTTDLPYLHYQACDVTDTAQLASVLKQNFSVIVITMTPSERSDAGYETAYVQTCQSLVDTLNAQSLEPRLLVFISSSAVYAQMDGGWVDENSLTEPGNFSGKRLLEAEAIIRDSRYRNTILRFSGIYGRDRNRLIEQVRQGNASASIHFTNRIHADDCARTINHLIELNRSGKNVDPIYLASDNAPAPMVEVVSWLAEQMGIENFLSETAANERGNKRCSNQRLLDSGFVFHYSTYRDGYKKVLAEYLIK